MPRDASKSILNYQHNLSKPSHGRNSNAGFPGFARPPTRTVARNQKLGSALIPGDGVLTDYVLSVKAKYPEALEEARLAVQRIIRREVLFTRVMALVSAFFRGISHPEWTATGTNALRKLCWDMVNATRFAKRMYREVDAQISAAKLTHAVSFQAGEASLDRIKRVDSFWDQYGGRGDYALAQERSSGIWRRDLADPPCDGVSFAQNTCMEFEPELSSNAPLEKDKLGDRRRPSAPVSSLPMIMRRRPFTASEAEVVPMPPPSRFSSRGQKLQTPCNSATTSKVVSTSCPSTARSAGRAVSRSSRGVSTLRSSRAVTAMPGSRHGHRVSTAPLAPRATTAPHKEEPQSNVAMLPAPPWAFGGDLAAGASTWSSIQFSQELTDFAGSLRQDAQGACDWVPPFGGVHLEPPRPAQGSYLGTCWKRGLMPVAVPFVTGHSTNIRLSGQALTDEQLLPIIAMVETEKVKDIDLSGNTLLSDKSVFHLINKFDDNKGSVLVKLDLKGCTSLGPRSLKAVEDRLADSGGAWCNILELDLSGIRMPTRSFLGLSKAIGIHDTLHTLRIADTGLGYGGELVTQQILGEILRNRHLDLLDVGWSNFSVGMASRFGALCVNSQLRTLLMPNSCASCDEVDAPIQYLLEKLASLESLTRLDAAMNGIDYRAALVLEDAFEGHQGIVDLDVSRNPLGTLGFRSVLRVLGLQSSGLRTLRCSHIVESAVADAQIFDAQSPHGRYHLDLSKPYHRAMLRKFYKTVDRFKARPSDAFQEVAAVGNYRHPKRGTCGQYQVATQGKLSFIFRVSALKQRTRESGYFGAQASTASTASTASAAGEQQVDFNDILERSRGAVRLRLSLTKVGSFFTFWQGLCTESEQLVVLDALASDFLLTYPQLRAFARSIAAAPMAVARVLHCVQGGETSRYLSLMLAPSHSDYLAICERQSSFLAFNPGNPTGHYDLDLANPGDCMVADQLLVFDEWEAEMSRSLHRTDTSQYGDHSHLRNFVHAGQPRQLLMNHLREWIRPIAGELVFDYATEKRPSMVAAPVSQEAFEGILGLLRERQDLPDDNRVDTLRRISHHIQLSALQMRELIGMFSSSHLRADVVVTFYFHIYDIENEKVFRAVFDDNDPAEFGKVRERLGWVATFPFVQPEGCDFHLELCWNDQRFALWLLVQLAEKENRTSIVRPDYVGHVDGIGVPMDSVSLTKALGSWLDLEKIPHNGTFTASYACQLQDRRFQSRKLFCEKYGFWKIPGNEETVRWWATLGEMPGEVLNFATLIYTHCEKVQALFGQMDVARSGHIDLDGFKTGIDKYKSNYFAGTEGQQRLEKVFKHFRNGDEETIPLKTWKVVEVMRKEITLSLQEFVLCLQRTLGLAADADDFLIRAWMLMNESAATLTESDWIEASLTKVQYFGNSRQIFVVLDKDGDGYVDFTKFGQLQACLEVEI